MHASKKSCTLHISACLVAWVAVESDYNRIMALKSDDTVCFCFHVPLRKIETFCRVEKPRTPSQISDCLSAGTGCGWCVPMLKQIHGRICGPQKPWWQQHNQENQQDTTSVKNDPKIYKIKEDITFNLTADEYAAGRRQYIAEGKGHPPPENNTEVPHRDTP